MMNSINYKAYKEANSSGKKPGFISGEKRFFEPSYKYEDELCKYETNQTYNSARRAYEYGWSQIFRS